MTIKELADKYKLSQYDFWELPQKAGCWIISHDACEKIAAIEHIELVDISVLNSERDFARFLITMKKSDKIIKTVGEAELISGRAMEKKSKKGCAILFGNCESQFIGCMAEKRGIDRAVLKLIDAYQYGVYSETENDDFGKQPEEPKPVQSKIEPDIQLATQEQWQRLTGVFKIPGNKEKVDEHPDVSEKCKWIFSNQKQATKIQIDEILDKLDEIIIPF